MPSIIMLLYFLTQFLFLGCICAKALSDFEKIAQAYKCDPNCWFREEEVNSTTIAKWPVNCTEVCGIIRFRVNSDLSAFELKEYFKNLKVIKGSLSFLNTQYSSIEFLSSLEEVHCDATKEGFSFNDNRNLELLNFGNLTNITCDFYAANNKVFDATDFCQEYGELALMFVSGNYKDCEGCIVKTHLHPSDLSQYEGCPSLINTIWFMSFYTAYVDIPDVMSPFKDVQTISGCLLFRENDLKNFSFFESLETIRLCDNSIKPYDLDIFQCYNLTRFDMPSLKTIKSKRNNFVINVEQVHDDFCFTTSEMHFFLENDVVFNNIEAKYCQNETDEMACVFDEMSSLQSNCTDILGNVTVKSGDEVHVEKLRNVKNIYGSLLIQNTSLTSLNFLGKLEYLAVLNDSSVPFQINSNKQLQNASLPSLKRVFSPTPTVKYQITFKDNGNQFLNSSACLNLMEGLFLTNVLFDGKECEVIDRTNDNSKNVAATNISKFLILFLIFKIFQVQHLN